jgi:hypothetical protein
MVGTALGARHFGSDRGHNGHSQRTLHMLKTAQLGHAPGKHGPAWRLSLRRRPALRYFSMSGGIAYGRGDRFRGQNWLITPAALAVGEAPPQNLHGQKWLLFLSGVAWCNFEGSDYPAPVVDFHIAPDIPSPLHFAIGRHGIPRPPGTEGLDYLVQFQLEQWAPFVTMSEIIDQNSDVAMDSVDRWRPSPFIQGTDAFNGAGLTQIFDGIIASVRVMSKHAYLQRMSYNITLLGKIVFTSTFIT